MACTNHGRGTSARQSSTWPFAAALALTLAWAGCAGAPASGGDRSEVPPLQPFQIRTVQRELRLRGFRIEPTGEVDEATRAALAEFQDSKRLPRTGQPDYATLRELGVNPDPKYNCEINHTLDCGPPGR